MDLLDSIFAIATSYKSNIDNAKDFLFCTGCFPLFDCAIACVVTHAFLTHTYISHEDLTACFGSRASVRHASTHLSVSTETTVHVHS